MYDLLVARETLKTCPKGEDGKKLERSSLNKRITAWKQKRGEDPRATHTPTCPYLVHPWRVLIAFKFPADVARTGVRPVTTAGKNGNGGGDKKENLERRDRVICNLVVETAKTRRTIRGEGLRCSKGALTNYEEGGVARWTEYPVIWAGATRLSRRPKNHDFVAAEVYIIREN